MSVIHTLALGVSFQGIPFHNILLLNRPPPLTNGRTTNSRALFNAKDPGRALVAGKSFRVGEAALWLGRTRHFLGKV